MRRVRRLRILLLALALVPLFGAAPEAGLAPPTVVVYPLTSTGRSAAETGSNVSVVLATKLAELGGLALKPYTPGTARPQYLDAARKEGADYYVTGFMTPVGAEVSLIVQVVSTSSGSIVYSTSTMARTYADAANQAEAVRSAIVRHASRGLPGLSAPLAPPSGSPAPSASEAGSVNLTKALRRKRGRPPAAQASSTPVPAATPPAAATPLAAATAAPPGGESGLRSASVAAAPLPGRRLVTLVGGPADPTERSYAATALAAALRRGGAQSGLLAVMPEEAAAHLAELCKANAGTQTLYASTLALEAGPNNAAHAVLDITALDCRGAPVIRRHIVASAVRRRNGAQAAIDRAAADAIRALERPDGAK